MAKAKPKTGNKSEAIRSKIELIPAAELASAKPERVLKALAEDNWERDASLQSTTSRLLKEAKQKTGVLLAPVANSSALEIAAELVKTSGSFEAARSVIATLEAMVRTIPR